MAIRQSNQWCSEQGHLSLPTPTEGAFCGTSELSELEMEASIMEQMLHFPVTQHKAVEVCIYLCCPSMLKISQYGSSTFGRWGLWFSLGLKSTVHLSVVIVIKINSNDNNKRKVILCL